MTSGNQQLKPEIIARFAKCPDCGSTDWMMKRLGKELKEQGLIGENMEVGVFEVGGPIIDPAKVSQMLSVSTRPAMYALRDICIGCGRLITVKIERRIELIKTDVIRKQ